MRDKKTIKKIKSVGFCSIHLMPALGPGFALLASGVLIGLHKLKMCCLSSCLLVQVALIAGATQSPSGVLTDGPTTGLGLRSRSRGFFLRLNT